MLTIHIQDEEIIKKLQALAKEWDCSVEEVVKKLIDQYAETYHPDLSISNNQVSTPTDITIWI